MKNTLEPATNKNPESEHFDTGTGVEHLLAPHVEPESGCRCDRWGHPCPDCRHQTRWAAPAAAIFPETKTTK